MKLLSIETGLAIILGSTIWGMAYSGRIVVYLVILFYFCLMFMRKKQKVKIIFNAGWALMYLCGIEYFLGILETNTSSIYSANTEDIYNILSIFMVFCIASQFREGSYNEFFQKSKKIVVVAMSCLSILALYKYYMLTKGIYLEKYYYNGKYIFGASLVPDNNMFALAVLISFIMVVSLIRESKSLMTRLVCLIAAVPITLTIIFSGSRRSYIFITLIYTITFIRWLHKNIINMDIANYIRYLYFFTLMIFIFIAFINITGYQINLSNLANDPQILTTIERISTLGSDNATESFLPRSERWYYALEILNQSSWIQIFFGRGFDYLSMYVERFPSMAIEDYPHNPFLSALLYSGITGMLILVMLLLYSFYNMFKYRNVLGSDFVLIYIATFCFIMISGNSIFTYKLFLILTSFTLLASRFVNESTNMRYQAKIKLMQK